MTYEASPLMVVRSWYDFRLIEGLVEPRPLTVVIVVLKEWADQEGALGFEIKNAYQGWTLDFVGVRTKGGPWIFYVLVYLHK